MICLDIQDSRVTLEDGSVSVLEGPNVKLSGRPDAPDQRRGRTLSFSARRT